MKYRLTALCCAFLLSLGGCAKTPASPSVAPQELTADQRQLLDFVDRGDQFFQWSFAAPEGAARLQLTMEYYRDGKRLDPPADGGIFSAEPMEFSHLEEKRGAIRVAVFPEINDHFGDNLGQTDFFNRRDRSQWNIAVYSAKASFSSGFGTGSRLDGNVEENGKRYGVLRWTESRSIPAELDREFLLIGYTLQEGASGDGTAQDLETEPQWLQNAAYAYLLKGKFIP